MHTDLLNIPGFGISHKGKGLHPNSLLIELASYMLRGNCGITLALWGEAPTVRRAMRIEGVTFAQ